MPLRKQAVEERGVLGSGAALNAAPPHPFVSRSGVRAAEESTAGMANETFKMGVLRHPYGAGRATGGHARARRPGTPRVATLGGHLAQLNGGQVAKKAVVEAQISRTGRDGA